MAGTLSILNVIVVLFCNVVLAREYLVKTVTQDKARAGTDDPVSIIMYGPGGNSGELWLKNSGTHKVPLKRGQTDEFKFIFKDIGSIYEIKLKHTGNPLWSDWDLDYVMISTAGKPGESSRFSCWCEFEGSSKYLKKNCQSGFEANKQTGGICKDINECLKHPCVDIHAKCVNQDGSFRCDCPAGYEMPQGTNNGYCADKKECDSNNGGCSHICKEQTGYYECDCPSGYNLDSDKKNCNDIDECAATPSKCPAPGRCVNNPGSYTCECPTGYKKVNGLCEDINECTLHVNHCDTIVSKCVNKPGDYKCKCNPGYKNKTPKICEDINECEIKTHNCDKTSSICSNTGGDYSCHCMPGYHQGSTNKICISDKCGPLSIPTGGILSPSSCQTLNSLDYKTTCTVTCINGYVPVDPTKISITCLAGGHWSGNIPLCKPVSCPVLTPPANGGLWPNKCATRGTVFNSRCTYICDAGYNVVGNAVRNCQADKTYTGAPATCQKVIAKPWVQCPSSISEDLATGRGVVDLTSKWKLPTSNVDTSHFSYQITPPANNFVFHFGKHTVKWTATNEKGETAECSYDIRIHDHENPKVTNCPSDAIKLLTPDRSLKVTWPALQFTDNVGTGSPVGTHRNGQEFTLGTHNVEIYAEDPAGNRATCAFQIIIEKKGCPDLEGPVNGAKSCSVYNTDKFCTITCAGSKTLFAGTSTYGAFWTCQMGKWSPMNYVPDCVDFSTYVNGQACPNGMVAIDTYINYKPEKVCANCPTGTYYLQGQCMDCTSGTYQDVEGQTQCKPCPVGKSSYSGAKNLTRDCLDQCNFGESSPTGFQPCLHCDKTSYQDEYGQTQCKSCPVGMQTGIIGATTKDKCGTAPQIKSIQPITVTKTEGDSVTFDCLVSGTPYPIVVWKNLQLDKVPSDFLGQDSTQTIKNASGEKIGLSLTISGLTVHNTGQYECKLANSHGSVSAKATLTVQPDLNPGSGSGASPGLL